MENRINFDSPVKKRGRRLFGWAYASQGTVSIPIIIVTVLLALVGLLMLFSAATGYTDTGERNDLIKSQLFFLALSIGVIAVVCNIDYTFFYKVHLGAIALGVGLFLMAWCLIQNHSKDIRRYLNVFGIFSVEPSEILKFAMILFVCYYAYRNYDNLQKEGLRKPTRYDSGIVRFFLRRANGLNNSFAFRWYTHTNGKGEKCVFFDDSFYYHLVLAVGIIIPLILIVLSSHLSATVIYCIVALFLLLNCGARPKYLVAAFILVAIAGVIAVIMMSSVLKGYQMDRLSDWHLEPESGTQSGNALYAICSGGFLGKGYLNSTEKYGYVSEAQNDFIFSIFCEEFGFAGALILMLGYGILIVLIYRQGKKAVMPYASLSVQAIAVMLATQVILHIGVNTSFLPNTGITLPFFSSGGSALLIIAAEIGYVLSVSCGTRYPNERMMPGNIKAKINDETEGGSRHSRRISKTRAGQAEDRR